MKYLRSAAALTHSPRLPYACLRCARSGPLRARHGALTGAKGLECAAAGRGQVAHQGFISLLYGWVVIT